LTPGDAVTTAGPINAAARATAQRLTACHSPGLAVEVEAALSAEGTDRDSWQYVDPVSVGALIVSVATLAWTVYADTRKRTSHPSPDVIIQQVRAEFREYEGPGVDDLTNITRVVVTEIVQAARDDY
jgi:hypothetical protein